MNRKYIVLLVLALLVLVFESVTFQPRVYVLSYKRYEEIFSERKKLREQIDQLNNQLSAYKQQIEFLERMLSGYVNGEHEIYFCKDNFKSGRCAN